jgi:hypothetical protein
MSFDGDFLVMSDDVMMDFALPPYVCDLGA